MLTRCLVPLAAAVVFLAANQLAAEAPMDAKVKLPQRLMTSTEVLRTIHEQTGAKYAYPTGALVRQIDATPFAGEAAVRDVVAKLAPKVSAANGVIVLEADLPEAERKKLTDQLASDKTDDRRVAAYLLGNTGSTKAVAGLFAALSDKDESVRHHALRSLDRLERDFQSYCPPGRESIFRLVSGPPIGVLEKFMEAEPLSNEWIWAAGLSGRIGPVLGPRGDGPVKAIGELSLHKASANGYARTRATAKWALARFDALTNVERIPRGRPGELPDPAALVEQFKSAKDAERQAELLLQLGRAGGKDAWDLILVQLEGKDPDIRRAAIRALDRCPDPRAVTALVGILTGPEEPVTEPPPEKGTPPSAGTLAAEYRNLAAMSLGMIASPEAAKALADYLAKTPVKPISTVGLALSWMAGPGRADVEGALIACVKVKDRDEHGQENCMLRSFAYIGLARIGTPDALAAIVSKYNEYDNTARYVGHSAVRLAGAWTQAAVDRFTELVATGKGKISPHGLEMAEDPRAVDALIDAAGKSSGDRLSFALQALGRIGDPKAVPTLLALLDHKESWAQYDAFRALRWRWHWNRPDVQAALTKHPLFKTFLAPAPSLADQPENTWVLRRFPVDFDDYRDVNTTYEAGMAFDESTGKAVKVNAHGQRCDAPQLGETWLYDPKANTWSETKSPVQPFGMCGTWNIAYDRGNAKVVYLEAEGGHHGWQMERARALRGSVPWVYDGASDTWTPMNPLHSQIGPGLRGFGPLVYIDSIGKVFLHGSAWGGNSPKELASRSWTYDTYSNTWTMLPESKENPGNPSHQPMCYLPNVDKVVMVAGGKTWLFDPKTNLWSDAKAAGTPKSRLPLRYDPATGTALLFDAQPDGTRIWQYDPKANAWRKVDSPVDISPHHDSVDCVYDPKNNVFIMDGGHINWNSDCIAVREVWTYRFKSWSSSNRAQPKPADAPVQPGPPLVDGVVASVLKDGTVGLRWDPPASGRAIVELGYHVYAATVETGTKMHHRDVFRKVGQFVKLNADPVKDVTFTDTRKLASAGGLFSHEIRAYYVKAVDAKGAESGPSAIVLTLASSVPRVSAVEQPDGTTLIKWDASPERDIQGYAVYRLDEFRPTLAVRLNPVPVAATQYVDCCESPRAERRRYYVLAVDALGQEGIPSTGAWSFGRP